MEKEEIYKLYQIDDDSFLDYYDVLNTYTELLESELNKENINTAAINIVIDGYMYMHSIFYPEKGLMNTLDTENQFFKIIDEESTELEKLFSVTSIALLTLHDLKCKDLIYLANKLEYIAVMCDTEVKNAKTKKRILN